MRIDAFRALSAGFLLTVMRKHAGVLSMTSPNLTIVKKTDADQNIAAMDHNKVTLNNVVMDAAGLWDAVNNCFSIPAGKAGVYVVLGQCQWRPYAATDGYRFIDLLDKNGAIFANFTWPDNKAAVPASAYHDGEVRQQVIGLGVLAEGDTLALYAEQDNSAGATVAVQNYNTWFAILGPLAGI